MKKLAKKAVAAVLGYQIRQLVAKNQFKVVGVVGSIGKTSSKLAIAQTLGTSFRVRYQDGNYNDIVSVPLIFFNESIPNLFNPLAWLAVFWRNQKQLNKPYPYDVVVVELGSDEPGLIAEFKAYLKLEIGVLTAITPEHMANFADLDAVAKEELTIVKLSSLVLANSDLVDAKYLSNLDNLLTYSLHNKADYGPGDLVADAELSEPELYSRLAATAVATKLGIEPADIKKGLASIKPVPGRMQRLAGINKSTIIDDSYNASPDAVKLVLESFYKMKAPQKIALLGNMNELGKYSESAHQEIGELCDPKQLDLVVTLGPDANKYLAPAAKHKGCSVEMFDSPYQAGEFIKQNVKSGALILIKGSQNRVFAEEAIKSILADPKDVSKLVRQSSNWMAAKKKAFSQ